MDTPRAATETWLEEALVLLGEAGLKPTLDHPAMDGSHQPESRIALDWGDGIKRWDVAVKPGARVATAPARPEGVGSRQLVVTDYLSPTLAAMARASGVNFVDLAGNMYLRDAGLLIDVRGRKPEQPPAHRETGFTKAELRVVLGVLSNPELALRTVREVTEAVGVSRGSVHTAIRLLREGGFIGKGGLRRGTKLLDDWTQAFITRGGLHTSQRKLVITKEALGALKNAPAVLAVGGEDAASTLGWGIRPASCVIYTDNPGVTTTALKLRREGVGFECLVRTPLPKLTDNVDGLVSSALIRADMLASGDSRQIEIGQGALHSDPNLRRICEIS